MKLKATDTLHITAVQADAIRPGDTFEVEDAAAKSLIDRGLAKAVAAPAAKAEDAPKNKAEAKPANRAKG